jgi:putative methyltransferase
LKIATRVFRLAGEVVDVVRSRGISTKNALYSHGIASRLLGIVNALVVETLKHTAEATAVVRGVDGARAITGLTLVFVVECVVRGKEVPRGEHPELDWVRANHASLEAAMQRLYPGSSSSRAAPAEPAPALPRYIRCNTLLGTVSETERRLSELGLARTDDASAAPGRDFYWRDPVLADVFALPASHRDLHKEPFVVNGKWALQDRASCLSAAAMGPGRGWWVADACSAPGNKTSHMAALVGRGGKVFAFERSPQRAKVLKDTLKRAGAAGHCVVKVTDFTAVNPDDFPRVAAVMVDPSCSGSGLDRDGAEQDSSPERLRGLAALQTALVLHAMRFPGASVVVYSTCSIHREENEDVVEAVLAGCEGKWAIARALPDWPHRGLDVTPSGPMCCRADREADLTSGFFVARFERVGPPPADPDNANIQGGNKRKQQAQERQTGPSPYAMRKLAEGSSNSKKRKK